LKAFVSIPVQILGKQFDGTRESAKEITNWIKSDPNSRYNSAELRENVDKFGFDSDQPHSRDSHHVLNIEMDQSRLYLTKNDWAILFVDTGVYSTYSDERLHENYAEL
jgi:hypothetical protein